MGPEPLPLQRSAGADGCFPQSCWISVDKLSFPSSAKSQCHGGWPGKCPARKPHGSGPTPSQAWTLTLCSDPPELSLDLGRRTSAGPANSQRYTDETEAASFASLSVQREQGDGNEPPDHNGSSSPCIFPGGQQRKASGEDRGLWSQAARVRMPSVQPWGHGPVAPLSASSGFSPGKRVL